MNYNPFISVNKITAQTQKAVNLWAILWAHFYSSLSYKEKSL